MKNLRCHQKGFSYIEVLVVMSVIGLLLSVMVVNLRAGQSQDGLRTSASKLADMARQAQSAALAGQTLQGSTQVPPAYGIQVVPNASGTVAKASPFADTAQSDSLYNLAPTDERLGVDVVLDVAPDRPTTYVESITAKNVSGGESPVASLDVAFTTPLGTMRINNDDNLVEAAVILKNQDGLQKKVTFNRITGRIDAEY